MPLSIAKIILQFDIEKAFEKAYNMSREPPDDEDKSAKIRKKLAEDLAKAIDAYTTSAQVDISTIVSTVPPGVAVAAPPPAGAGATIAPGISSHVGFGSLK